MPNTIMVCGYGPGISDSVARRFGREGFQVALVARRADKLDRGAAELKAIGIEARGFPCDLANPNAVKKLVSEVRDALGPISVLHWNAFSSAAGDLTSADMGELHQAFDSAVSGLVVAVQQVLPDLRAVELPAVLVTGGALSQYDPASDALAARWNVMGLAVGKAAQHKLVRVLNAKLAPENIYVGEVTVSGVVKGTAADRGNATIDPAAVAQRFWDIYQERSSVAVRIS